MPMVLGNGWSAISFDLSGRFGMLKLLLLKHLGSFQDCIENPFVKSFREVVGKRVKQGESIEVVGQLINRLSFLGSSVRGTAACTSYHIVTICCVCVCKARPVWPY